MLKSILLLCGCCLLSSCILPITVFQTDKTPLVTNKQIALPDSINFGLPSSQLFSIPDLRSVSGWDYSKLDTASGLGWSQDEQDILLAVNMLRTQPSQFAEVFLRPIMDHLQAGKTVLLPGNLKAFNYEGLRAVKEAYEVLKSSSNLNILAPSSGIQKAANEHVKDQGQKGETGHTGTDGSDPKKRLERFGICGDYCGGENISYGKYPNGLWHIVGLVVDDNVSSRGHRNNLLKPEYRFMGVACGKHNKYEWMCVQDFAGSFQS